MACEFKQTDRSGLYIMVFIAMVSSCTANDRLKEMRSGICGVSLEKPSPKADSHLSTLKGEKPTDG